MCPETDSSCGLGRTAVVLVLESVMHDSVGNAFLSGNVFCRSSVVFSGDSARGMGVAANLLVITPGLVLIVTRCRWILGTWTARLSLPSLVGRGDDNGLTGVLRSGMVFLARPHWGALIRSTMWLCCWHILRVPNKDSPTLPADLIDSHWRWSRVIVLG